MFEFRSVTYRYKQEKDALHNLSFRIRANCKTAIVGGNGAGKSTLVFHLNGLFRTEQGEVLFRGEPITRKNQAQLVHHVGIVFQDPDDQLVSLTVRDDVAFGPIQLGVSPEEVEARVRKYLDLLDITHLAERSPSELSYGQKKLAAIAGILAMETEVIILDEPMAFLDPAGKKRIQEVMHDLSQAGKTVIITTHDMQLVAEWADECIVMKEGQCLGTMTPSELFAKPFLVEEARLQLPPVAELLSAVWTGAAESMPIRLEEAKEWLIRHLKGHL
ncbi:energy-coupling factor ABC transporter ATP-binding protein [Brevibacillus ginsengisoli]|uniref:energy-coupling factor ABC transporter ATP-binding protein n=1 Tax=Brevibacillus ginsengisoli TaxID=363854 RepID=UPI003CF69BC1